MEYNKIIHNYISDRKDEIICNLKELIKKPSVREKSEKDAPFGKNCAAVLDYTEKLYSQNGFKTEKDKQGGYLLSYYGKGNKSIGFFSHSDVVSVNNDWIFTLPFEPIEKDGFIIGRGALDDKAAIIISLYCAKMLKELKIPFNSKLIMFTGSSEETGMEDIDNYLKNHSAPDFSLICDTAFPLYRGNKSGMNCWIKFNSELKDIKNFYGGTAMNITLANAFATVNGEILTENGISRHSALPEGSVNAGYLLAKKLSQLPNICNDDKKQMTVVANILEKHYGEVFGIEHTDINFGKLTCTNGIIKTEDGKITLGINMRFGLSANTDEIRKKINDFCIKNNCTAEYEKEKTGYIVSEENKYIKACLKAYGEFTGDTNPKTYINAGGTYGRKLPCAAEIGPTLKWGTPQNTPPGHGGAHQPDECINIQGFLDALELTLHMLIECDKIHSAEE